VFFWGGGDLVCFEVGGVRIDPRKGEQWFCAEEEAMAAGWQKSAACNNIWQTSD
tara:strand:+ start:23239 stop:23400 length:162 start_codon:yes stop_codon:yes gene_type:complete